VKQEWFKCTAPEDVLPEGRFWCESTKGDLLALYWLILSVATDILEPPISEEAKLVLQVCLVKCKFHYSNKSKK
jgi:hypothetical protein